MADSVINVRLNRGLDTETPTFLQEPGSLSNILNYEFSGADGVRRIDGFERYDGGPNGDIVDYMIVQVNVTDPAIIPLLVPNAPLYRFSTGAPTAVIGTVIDFIGPTTLTYAPIEKVVASASVGDTLDVLTTGPGRMSVLSPAASGVISLDAETYIGLVQQYSADLRATVAAQANPVAGVYWLRKTAIAAIDTPTIILTNSEAGNVFSGRGLTNNGVVYRVAGKVAISGTTNTTIHLEPTDLTTALVGVQVTDDGGITSAGVVKATSVTLSTGSSDRAYLVRIGNPDVRDYAGSSTVIPRSTFVTFDTGTQSGGVDPVVGDILSLGTFWWVVKSIDLDSGSWSAGTAAGTIELVPETSAGNGFWPGLKIGDALAPIGGGSSFFTVDSVYVSELAGTKALRNAQSKYVWNTYNFNGDERLLEAYGANGVTRAFWVQCNDTYSYIRAIPDGASLISNEYSWGNILAVPEVFLDKPSFTSIHAGTRLALGYKRGSVLLSVVGVPYDFDGVRGALEIATGDELTGLLDAQNDSTILFGRRSVRRLTGNLDVDMAIKTISGSTGAFPYTAVLVGAMPVFTGTQGITTLEQSEAYGDFQGNRVSSLIAGELRPKLVSNRSGTELGGTVMALPVRNKDQYRLWLANGEVIVATFSKDAIRLSRSKYNLGEPNVRVPIAASSEIGDDGKERMFVVWDYEHARTYPPTDTDTTLTVLPDPNMIYEMDKGWGFDGLYFNHYFELVPVFPSGALRNNTISKVRMFGKGYGIASLQVKSAGIEDDFDQAYHNRIQDLSMPRLVELYTTNMRPVTAIIDQANWGLGIKLRIENTVPESETTTEPSHICQVLVLHTITEGAQDG